MTASVDDRLSGQTTELAPELSEMAELIEQLTALLATREARRLTLPDEDSEALAATTGFAPRRQGKPEVVLGGDVAVELGHPSTSSKTLLLVTNRDDLVHDRHLTIIGPDLDQVAAGERRPFGQVVLVRLNRGETPDPFDLDGTQFLINRLPGYMVRSIPGRLWVRVSRQGLAGGLRLDTVARALGAAFRDFPEVAGVEVIFITSSDADVDALAPIALAASVISGRHKKLVLSPDGDLECNEMSCETCDEKPVCDDLRDIVRERRRKPSR